MPWWAWGLLGGLGVLAGLAWAVWRVLGAVPPDAADTLLPHERARRWPRDDDPR